MKHICVIGTGYVGLVNATCFADLGNKVVTVDIDEAKIAKLKRGEMPIYEPGLEELVERNVRAGRLSFTTSYEEGLEDAEFVFVCVGTPSAVDGEADLKYVRAAAQTIAQTMKKPLIIINKSTVPVGTGDWTTEIISKSQPKPIPFAVVSCPEFLREGVAIQDFMKPDRTVLGSSDRAAAEKVAALYEPLGAPVQITDIRTAEMIKYASNAFLATRISFINEISIICERLGADVTEVAKGMGYDKRIGPHFLQAGTGYGGSCFMPDETLFTLNSPNVAAERIVDSFQRSVGTTIQEGDVQVKYPQDKHVLGFDVHTGQSIITRVKALTKRPYQGMMVTVKTSMGRELRVTTDHPVLIHDGQAFRLIPAIHVAPGDRVATLMRLPQTTVPSSYNLLDWLAETDLEQDVFLTADEPIISDAYDQHRQAIASHLLKRPEEIKRRNRMSLRVYRHLQATVGLSFSAEKIRLYTAKDAEARLSAHIEVDSNFMRLLGYYVSEGFISQDVGRDGSRRERISFTFHEDERECLGDVQSILRHYGLKFIVRTKAHTTTIMVSSRVLAWLIRDVLGCGTNPSDKALPNIAFNVSDDLRLELARGAFSGDSALTTIRDGEDSMLEYATTSKRLADGMTLLLQSIGVVPSVCQRMTNKSAHLAYVLRIGGHRQLDRMRNVLADKRRRPIDDLLSRHERHIAQGGFQRYEDYAILTVQDVEYMPVDTQVYSLETEAGVIVGSYGMIQKQCFPKDVKALANMALTHGMHPQLLNAVMEINDFQRKHIVIKVRDLVGGTFEGKVIGVLGLAFKENTDDVRESPALTVVRQMMNGGAQVRAYDPVAMDNAIKEAPGMILCHNPYDVAEGVDCLVIMTPWNEFKQLDMARILRAQRHPNIVDGRNLYDPATMRRLGFTYRGVGRGYNGAGHHDEA
ncbi:MAG: nucleotide sugar dehydrogenase [Anaerolineae bacterium]|nr:nucleotide sugar dehydrogenase [Anaerolineae bacterium]MDW8172337.1 nucleotide sugar dehydrogenase [Anaerolineae bacterium]